MDALALDIEERTFDMDPEHARHAGFNGASSRGDGARDDIEVGADQSGHEARRAEAPVSASDLPDHVDTRRVVEQHAAAAIHLRVDESGQEHVAAEVDRGRAVAARMILGNDVENAAAFEQHALPRDERLSAQHPPVVKRNGHQTVSVTFLRLGGRSGSSPRARESAFAMR